LDYAEELKLPQVTGRFTDNKLSQKAINFVFSGISSIDEPSTNNKPMVVRSRERTWQVPPERTEVI
jgi:hypothetical protein